ncbi:hypothetical protein PR048_016284 [Dryococelus australis]|uniref:Uncharacterized protein n=1 Tax=Dryococelus australis TaxID=614101 RepID=A0ABQ9HJB2_9NEOP|nr:hypothetical protein PR048_016284 [Dryococelus australis]
MAITVTGCNTARLFSLEYNEEETPVTSEEGIVARIQAAIELTTCAPPKKVKTLSDVTLFSQPCQAESPVLGPIGHFIRYTEQALLKPTIEKGHTAPANKVGNEGGKLVLCLGVERRMNKVMRPVAMLILHKAVEYTTCTSVDLKQDFQKCCVRREEAVTVEEGLTPKAEYRLVRLCCSLFRKTSDLGRGGFLGLRMTRASSRMSSSSSFESLDTESCRCTRSCPNRNTIPNTCGGNGARPPPTKANRVQSPAGSPDFRKWDDVVGRRVFSGISSFPRPSIFTSITLIGSQDLAAYSRQKAKSKYRNRIRLERASQKQSNDTHKTPYDRVKRCRERKINIKAPERVNVDIFAQNKRPRSSLGHVVRRTPAGLDKRWKKNLSECQHIAGGGRCDKKRRDGK